MLESLDAHLQRFEQVLAQTLANTIIPAKAIKEAITYALFPGGKRFRPSLVYLCGDLLHVKTECLDVLAMALELTHAYSLIHDDLPAMDNDDFRRGKPSCHRAFSEATAILAGDGLQALAIEILVAQLPQLVGPENLIKIIRDISSATGVSGMISGQSLDLSELSRPDITPDELTAIHHLKTGKLIYATINSVINAQETTAVHRQSLRDFAQHLGLVFQMQDDYLDSYASFTVSGKNRASDSVNRKTTFASLLTRERLLGHINSIYQEAYACLDGFGDLANDLLLFCKKMQHRTS